MNTLAIPLPAGPDAVPVFLYGAFVLLVLVTLVLLGLVVAQHLDYVPHSHDVMTQAEIDTELAQLAAEARDRRERADRARARREASPANQRTPAPWFDVPEQRTGGDLPFNVVDLAGRRGEGASR